MIFQRKVVGMEKGKADVTCTGVLKQQQTFQEMQFQE